MCITSGEYAEADAIVDRLVKDYPGHSGLQVAVTEIAEQYYTEAFRMEEKGDASGAKGNLQKAAGLWQMAIDNLPTDAKAMPQACCWAGDCYHTLREYEKSRGCFQKVVDGYPEYRYAWHALYMVGRNYQDMGNSGLISKSEADTKTKAAYQQLLEKYPNCEVADEVRQWLSGRDSKAGDVQQRLSGRDSKAGKVQQWLSGHDSK